MFGMYVLGLVAIAISLVVIGASLVIGFGIGESIVACKAKAKN